MSHDPLCEASSGNPYAVLANQISTDLVGWCSTCELIAKVRADERYRLFTHRVMSDERSKR